MSFPHPTPHGYELEPDLHRTLRGRPPAGALDWLLEQLGGDKIIEVEALSGGTSSAVHRVRLGSRRGATLSVILRRYVLDWLAEEPWTPGNEVHALRLLADSPVAAPRLLAADPDGVAAGTPTVAMSDLPGQVDWRPRDLDGWLRRLAEALPAVHAVRPDSRLRSFAPYPPEQPLPPSWTRHPAAWDRAVELFEGPQPDVPQVFLHRDFHPGNVLWSDDQVSGIVDWPSACVGAAEADVAHCRANLGRQFGIEVADRFLALWQAITGTADYHPYWDLTDVISWTGSDDEQDPALDAFVEAAARRL